MAFENFPYTNFHEINLDWIVARVKEAYSASNPPDYPVTSVNGQTGDVIIAIPSALVRTVNGESGDVILYRNPLIQFPTTDESRWNLFRICDGNSGDARGIEFDEDGAHRIEGIRRIMIYDEENQPDYPVTSVNGQTGDVRITAGVNSVNGKTGNVVTPFVNPNSDILKLDSNSNTILWGISRDVAGGNTALYITTGAGSPQAFIRYTPETGEPINLPLLSSADIPAEAGVISVNGATGVVTLYGTNINTSDTSGILISDKLNAINRMATSLANITMAEASMTWNSGGIDAMYGTAYSNAYLIRSGTLPNNIALIAQKNQEMQFRLYAYGENNAYQGVYHADTNTFAPESTNPPYNIMSSIDLQTIRKSFPTYTFRVTASTNPSVSISAGEGASLVGLYYLRNEDISQIEADVAALQTSQATQDQQIATLQTADSTHDSQIATIQAKDNTQDQQISALQDADTAHNQQISALQSANATHDSQIAAIQAKDNTQDQQISELYTRAGVYVVSIPNANTLPLRFPASGTDAKIKNTNKVVNMDLSIPGVQVSNWTITTYDGYLEITGTMNGGTNMTLYLA